jgi:hypothetical protein
MAKDVRVKLTADAKGLKKGIDSGTASLKGFDKQAKTTASTLLKMGTGFVSFAAVLGQARKGFTDLISETQGMSKVNAVTENHHNLTRCSERSCKFGFDIYQDKQRCFS